MDAQPMQPKHTRIPSYRLHKPSGHAVVTLSGTDQYLGPFNSPESRAKYDRVVAEWLSSNRTAQFLSRDHATVNELVLTYWEHCKTYYTKNGQPTSEQSLVRSALRRFRRLYGEEPVESITALSVKAVRELMIEEELSRSTINAYVGRIVACFRWGVEEGIVPPGVLHGLRALRGLQHGRSRAKDLPPVGCVSDELVEATLPHLPPVITDMVLVQRLTGMRPGEVCSITVGQIDMADEIWIYQPKDHKTAHHGHNRVIPIGPRAQRIMNKYIRPELGAPLFPSTTNSKGRHEQWKSCHYSSSSYARAINRACVRTGLPHWTPNQLRHTRATEVRRVHGIDAAGALLGHTKLETTQVYAERQLSLATSIALASG